jgi:hypothetical protein
LNRPSDPLSPVTIKTQVDDLYASWFFSNSIFEEKVTGYDSFGKKIL